MQCTLQISFEIPNWTEQIPKFNSEEDSIVTNTQLCTRHLDGTFNTAAPGDSHRRVVTLLCDGTDLDKLNALSSVMCQATAGSQTEIGALGHSPVL